MPVINSWINTLEPASPNARSVMIWSIAPLASSVLLQMSTPFPSASPSAFTAHLPSSDAANDLAPSASANDADSIVGMPLRSMNSCEKILDDSNCAACCVGPQARRPAAWN